jgi:hypothetical protein
MPGAGSEYEDQQSDKICVEQNSNKDVVPTTPKRDPAQLSARAPRVGASNVGTFGCRSW